MLFHLVKDSLMRRWRRAALVALSLLVGTALVSSLLAVSLDIEEKVGRELRSYGANIVLTPSSGSIPVEVGGIPVGEVRQKNYLEEQELSRLKTIFWKNNITAFAPYLFGTVPWEGGLVTIVGTWFEHDIPLESGEVFRTGANDTSPWWQVEGQWPRQQDQILVGKELASRMGLAPGDRTSLGNGQERNTYEVSGILSTGGYEENQIFMELAEAQNLLALPGKVEKVQVSALTKPPDDLARRARMLGDPRELPGEEYDKWYCSPYVDSITYQIEEALRLSKPNPCSR